jgi:hypothetical protein
MHRTEEGKPILDPTTGLRGSILSVVAVKPHCSGCLHNIYVRKPSGLGKVCE